MFCTPVYVLDIFVDFLWIWYNFICKQCSIFGVSRNFEREKGNFLAHMTRVYLVRFLLLFWWSSENRMTWWTSIEWLPRKGKKRKLTLYFLLYSSFKHVFLVSLFSYRHLTSKHPSLISRNVLFISVHLSS